MKIINWLIHRNEYESKKKINFKTVLNFLMAYFNHMFKKKHIKEQSLHRLEQIKIKSPECYNSGKCFCGCDINYIIYQPDACEEKNKCFGELLNKKEWNNFKNK